MSTPTVKIIYPTENILCGTYFVVHREKLSEAVKRLREAKNWSFEDVRKNCHGQLAVSYLWRIENGEVTPDVISVGKLTALAEGLQVPALELFNIVRQANGNGSGLESELIGYFRDLAPRRQEDLLRIAKMYFEEKSMEISKGDNVRIPEGIPVQYIRNKGRVTDGEQATILEKQKERKRKANT